MRHAAEAFDNVRVCDVTLPEEVIRLFGQRGKAFFEPFKRKAGQ
jgi:hypothetical protein